MLMLGEKAPGLRVGVTAMGVALMAAAMALPGCSNNSNESDQVDQASVDSNIKTAYVEIGDQNQAIARAVTTFTAQCPLINVDGATSRMTLRAGARTIPLRTTASAPADSKPSEFPVAVCEAKLPAGAKSASIGAHALPLPKANPQKILILADTGCRMKKAGNTFQSCNDADAWPLPKIAATATAMKPDLVIHIGDYHYRENACPTDIAGCAGSPWGYGWDVWDADLFTPAASLLAAAPWVVVRGNHEECARGGQGWFRFLDTEAYSSDRSCDDPANDSVANYSTPYAVAVGTDTQFVVFDSAKTGAAALKSTDAQFINYSQQFQKVATLTAKSGVNSIFANHHPILAYAPLVGADPAPGNPALQSVMTSLNGAAYYPPGVQMVLHGHVHDFQAVNFSSNHPATIVAGNGGDNLDVNFPDPFPMDQPPAPNTTIDAITHTSTFGFMTMERIAGGSNWTYKAYTRNGALLTTCTENANKLSCDKTGYLAAP
jgi:hypothetical protein